MNFKKTLLAVALTLSAGFAMAADLPQVAILATGGTIASAEDGNGLTPQLTGEQLAGYVPQAAELADIDIVQPMNIDSTNMRPAD